MARLLKHKTISGRLIRFFVLVILLPLYVFSFSLLYYTRTSIFEQARNNGQAILTQIASNISRQFISYQDLSKFIAADWQLQQLATFQDIEQVNQDDGLLKDISMLLRGYRLSSPNVEMVAIALKNQMIFSTDIDQAMAADIQSLEWYQQCVNSPGQIMTRIYAPGESPFPTGQERLTETIAQYFPIQDARGQIIGVAMILLYNHVFEQSIQNSLGNDQSFIYITDQSNKVIYSPVIQSIPDIVATNDYLLLTESVVDTDWTIHGMVFVGDSKQQILMLASRTFGLLLLLSVIMIVSAIWTGRSIVQPVHSLQNLALKVMQGDFSGRFKGQGSDEIQDLGSAFNAMSMNLQNLLDQVYHEQKLKREAELAALQANIKPHFLYNALDTVSWMARNYQAKDIVATVDALSSFFRIALSRGSDLISVQQEIKHVQSYLIIQKFRYETMLNFDIDLESTCSQWMVLKMILQPLVENAIYHGIKESGHDGTIIIRVWQNPDENCLYLAVEDNGIGIKPERLRDIQECLKAGIPIGGPAKSLTSSSNPYGILNVHHRLVLSYGDAYGLSIQSVYGEGTVALIRHPIIHPEENPKPNLLNS